MAVVGPQHIDTVNDIATQATIAYQYPLVFAYTDHTIQLDG